MTVTISINSNPELSINIANSNFADLWAALGLEFDWCGSISGAELKAALIRFSPSKLATATISEGNFIYCGRTLEQCTRYQWNLFQLCAEALETGEPILWG